MSKPKQKPSELIKDRVFALSNTVGTSQREEMIREWDSIPKGHDYAVDFIKEILQYLDDQTK